jgi:hypothetical protein
MRRWKRFSERTVVHTDEFPGRAVTDPEHLKPARRARPLTAAAWLAWTIMPVVPFALMGLVEFYAEVAYRPPHDGGRTSSSAWPSTACGNLLGFAAVQLSRGTGGSCNASILGTAIAVTCSR